MREIHIIIGTALVLLNHDALYDNTSSDGPAHLDISLGQNYHNSISKSGYLISDTRGYSDVVRDAVGLAANKQPKRAGSSAPTPPGLSDRRAAIDSSIRGIWRRTPYDIANITYQNERIRKIGQTGMHYEATISVTLRFPNGWLAQCIGPSAPWGCQHIDSNMMQTSRSPISAGEARTYLGRMTMVRTRADGEWVSRGGSWQQVAPAWESRVYWEQR